MLLVVAQHFPVLAYWQFSFALITETFDFRDLTGSVTLWTNVDAVGIGVLLTSPPKVRWTLGGF